MCDCDIVALWIDSPTFPKERRIIFFPKVSFGPLKPVPEATTLAPRDPPTQIDAVFHNSSSIPPEIPGVTRTLSFSSLGVGREGRGRDRGASKTPLGWHFFPTHFFLKIVQNVWLCGDFQN